MPALGQNPKAESEMDAEQEAGTKEMEGRGGVAEGSAGEEVDAGQGSVREADVSGADEIEPQEKSRKEEQAKGDIEANEEEYEDGEDDTGGFPIPESDPNENI